MSFVDLTTSIDYREIPGVDGYRFGSDGSAWRRAGLQRLGDWRPIRGGVRHDGIPQIYVHIHGKRKLRRLPKLMALAFHGPCPPGMECMHLDGDVTNNRPDNLRWATRFERLGHAPDSKPCALCGIEKPVGEYSGRSNTTDGLHTRCKACESEGAKAWRRRPGSRARIEQWARPARLRSRYGLTVADYDRMFASQGGVCALCGKPPLGGVKSQRLHVDHDHATGRVRGLLCNACNRAIGALGDDLAGVMRAVDYLRRALDPQRHHA